MPVSHHDQTHPDDRNKEKVPGRHLSLWEMNACFFSKFSLGEKAATSFLPENQRTIQKEKSQSPFLTFTMDYH